MTDADPLIRMRCADAAEKITAVRPEYLTPYKKRVLRLAAVAEQQEVRWHLAQLISRLELSAPERRRAVELLTQYLFQYFNVHTSQLFSINSNLHGK